MKLLSLSEEKLKKVYLLYFAHNVIIDNAWTFSVSMVTVIHDDIDISVHKREGL